MSTYRNALPQLSRNLFLTDGGIETTLIFQEGQDLPHFAAFHLLRTTDGRAALQKYFQTYAALAAGLGTGLILETPTWRANPDWAAKLDYSPDELRAANTDAVALVATVRREHETPGAPIVISGCIGPRGDGYIADTAMNPSEAADYHRLQVETFAASAVDLVTGITINYADEAVGITLAARDARLPVVISFTVETDGRLPTGQSLRDAITQVDQATDGYASYFMINCAHPSHLVDLGGADDTWLTRLRGLRANASRMSHAELNEAPELDAGNPQELGREYAELTVGHLKHLNVMGGCCGTDHRHIEQIALACAPLFRSS